MQIPRESTVPPLCHVLRCSTIGTANLPGICLNSGVKGVKMTNPSKGLLGKAKKRAVKGLAQLLNLLLQSKDLVTHKFLKQAKVCR